MYLQFLNYVAYFFTTVFFAFLFYALRWSTIKTMWNNAKAKVIIPIKQKEALAAGKIPFPFENGNVIIYAKTYPKALYEYKQLKRESRQMLRKPLKKV